MIDPKQLLTEVIRPVLISMDCWTENSERLILGTACKESECGMYLRQLGGGPGIGIYQMEPNTFNDIWTNYLDYRYDLRAKVLKWVFDFGLDDNSAYEMAGNLYYATAMCRVHYLRVPEPIPNYLAGQATYWKKYYNTEKGAGTTVQYLNAWNRFITPNVFV